MKIIKVMHTENPERAILRASQKNEKKKSEKKHTDNPEREIPRSDRKIPILLAKHQMWKSLQQQNQTWKSEADIMVKTDMWMT